MMPPMLATIWGTLPNWILIAVALLAAWRLSRGGAGSAVSELDKSNDVLTRALADTRDKLGVEIRDLRIENGELRGRTDVAIALAPVLEWTISHETRAQERHTSMIVVLDLIAARLGPDPNGGHDG
jgi:hypothetical protein